MDIMVMTMGAQSESGDEEVEGDDASSCDVRWPQNRFHSLENSPECDAGEHVVVAMNELLPWISLLTLMRNLCPIPLYSRIAR